MIWAKNPQLLNSKKHQTMNSNAWKISLKKFPQIIVVFFQAKMMKMMLSSRMKVMEKQIALIILDVLNRNPSSKSQEEKKTKLDLNKMLMKIPTPKLLKDRKLSKKKD